LEEKPEGKGEVVMRGRSFKVIFRKQGLEGLRVDGDFVVGTAARGLGAKYFRKENEEGKGRNEFDGCGGGGGGGGGVRPIMSL
jgi:hypothetical protein